MLNEVMTLAGINEPDEPADGIWYRIQPVGLELDHRSETSAGNDSDGVHVYELLFQALKGDHAQFASPDDGDELIVISGPNRLEDTEDLEGYVLPQGQGEIVGRFPLWPLIQEYQNEDE